MRLTIGVLARHTATPGSTVATAARTFAAICATVLGRGRHPDGDPGRGDGDAEDPSTREVRGDGVEPAAVQPGDGGTRQARCTTGRGRGARRLTPRRRC